MPGQPTALPGQSATEAPPTPSVGPSVTPAAHPAGVQSPSLTPGVCNALDLAKILFACIVVGMHQPPVAGDVRTYSWLWMGRLAVPFFFITSAFLFFLRNPGPAQLQKYVGRMLKLYGFWFIVMLPYIIHLRCVGSEGVLWNVGHLLQLFVLDSTFGGSWFLMATIISIPLVYYGERLIGLWGTIAVSLGVEMFLQAYGWKDFLPHEVVATLTQIDKVMPGVHNSFLAAMIFVTIGLLLARNWSRIERIPRRAAWGAAIAAVAMMAAWIIYMEKTQVLNSRTFLRVPAVTLLFIAIVRSNLTLALPYRNLRKASTVVYISHFLFIFLLKQLQYGYLHHSLPRPMQYLTVLASSLLLTALLIFLQRRPRLAWLKYAW